MEQTAEIAPPESKRTPHYPALDGLRTLAVAMVVAVHYEGRSFPLGWLGVQIFFVLSGFLITGILFDTRDSQHRFRNFYARRALRIFPLYYGFLLVAVLLLAVTHGYGPPHLWMWFVYVQNFWWMTANAGATDTLFTGHGTGFAAIGHFWSLAVEEQFYFLWPLVVFAARQRRPLMATCGVLIAFRIALAAYWQGHLSPLLLDGGVIYRMLPTQMDGFLLGGLLALWLRGRPSPKWAARAGAMSLLAVLAYTGVITTVYLTRGRFQAFDFRSGFQAVLGIPLSNAVSVALVFAVMQPGTWVNRLCRPRWLQSLGKISYGLYLFHVPVLIAMHGLVYRPVLCAALAVMATVGLSYLSFYGYEERFLRLKKYFVAVT